MPWSAKFRVRLPTKLRLGLLEAEHEGENRNKCDVA